MVAERSSARELRCPKCFWCRNKVARNSEPLCPPAFLNNQEHRMPVPGQTPAWAQEKQVSDRRFRLEDECLAPLSPFGGTLRAVCLWGS